MSKTPDIELAPEYAEDWIQQDQGPGPDALWQPAPPLPEGSLKHVAVVTDAGYFPMEVEVTSPDGTRVRITADPITGGLRITQVLDPDEERGMLATVPMGLGTILLDDRP